MFKITSAPPPGKPGGPIVLRPQDTPAAPPRETDAGPRHPLAAPSSLDERLRQGLVRQHFDDSIETGPAGYFLCLIDAARRGDEGFARALHDRLLRLGWDCRERELPEREGRR